MEYRLRTPRFTRRELFKGVVGAFIPDHLPTFTIAGGHDTATQGGAKDPTLLFEDMEQLGMRTVVCIDPRESIIDHILSQPQNARIRLISRLTQEDNLYHERDLLWTLNKLGGFSNPPVIPFNEPNIEGADISPEEHIHFHFMPAALKTIEKGGMPYITPLAPNGKYRGIDDHEYERRMFIQLREEDPGLNMIRRLGIAAHPYACHIGENPWGRVERINRLSQEIFGFSLPIDCTEGGLLVDYTGQYTDQQIADETIRILNLNIPTSLRGVVKSYCFWIIANMAQRDEPKEGDQGYENFLPAEQARFEDAAFRRPSGLTPAYMAMAERVRQARISAIYDLKRLL